MRFERILQCDVGQFQYLQNARLGQCRVDPGLHKHVGQDLVRLVRRKIWFQDEGVRRGVLDLLVFDETVSAVVVRATNVAVVVDVGDPLGTDGAVIGTRISRRERMRRQRMRMIFFDRKFAAYHA